MTRKIALPTFLLAAVLCAVWFAAGEKPSEEAVSLREQLIHAATSADAVYYYPEAIDSNQYEGAITDATYVAEICALLRQITAADDVEWPVQEEQYILSDASFMLLSGHDSADLTTTDGLSRTPRYYIQTDRDQGRSLLFVHNGSKRYENADYQLVGTLPFTGLDYTMAQDKRLQHAGLDGSKYENLTLTVEGDTWSARLQTGAAQPSGDGHSNIPYMLFGPNHALLEEGSVNCDETTAELRSFALREVDDVLGYPGFCFETQTWGGRVSRYYAVTGDGAVPAGMSHSFPRSDADDHSIDLDGDGRSEMVCNAQFNADGAQRVYIYRWNAQDSVFPVQTGSVSWEKAVPEKAEAASHGGAINRGELYHAADNTVELTWLDEASGGGETVILPLTPEIIEWQSGESARDFVCG